MKLAAAILFIVLVLLSANHFRKLSEHWEEIYRDSEEEK